jgi:hypothetical protein
MTIFDTIRYPITDIYNNRELEALPDDLWAQWVTEVQPNDDWDHSNCQRSSRATVVMVFISTRASNATLARSHYGSTTLMKDYFTRMLRRMIAEYEEN